jgi:NAD(P)H-flavin reductase
MVPTTFRVQRVTRETHDTFTLLLKPVNGGSPHLFKAGQFNMLYAFGVGEVPISISGDPDKREQLVHTIRSVGTVTNAIKSLRRDSVLGVRGPFGNPWPVDEAKGNDILIVTGGIGLAPLRPVLYSILSHRNEYGRIALLYGARTPDDILYKKELEKWRGRFDMYVDATVDIAKTVWHGNVGVVTTLIPRARFDPDNTTVMICGPEIMMRFTVTEILKRGVGIENIYVSMERNMKCGIGLCGHCQFGPTFICKDGPVFRYDQIQHLLTKRGL